MVNMKNRTKTVFSTSTSYNKYLYFHLYPPILSTFSPKTNTYIPGRLKCVKTAYSELEIKITFLIFAR